MTQMKEQMSTRRQWLTGLLSCTLGVIVLTGMADGARAEHPGATGKPVVDSGLANYVPVAGVSGRLTIAGSDTMQPLVARLASEFRRQYHDVKIGVEGGGSATALTGFLDQHAQSRRGDGNVGGHLGANEVMLMASSRELTSEEIKQFTSRHGHDPIAIPIAQDAVAIYVHRDNPLPGLTLEQVDAIFSKTRTRGIQSEIATWGHLGLTNGWEQVPLRLYGRDQRSATRAFLKEHVLLNGEFKDTIKTEPGAASVIVAIAKDRSGIGYSGIGFEASTVRVLPLAEKLGMPFVKPSAESATNGTYPLRRYLYLYVNKEPGEELELILREFLKFVNSREGQATVAKAGVYPLPLAEVTKNLRTLTGGAKTASLATGMN